MAMKQVSENYEMAIAILRELEKLAMSPAEEVAQNIALLQVRGLISAKDALALQLRVGMTAHGKDSGLLKPNQGIWNRDIGSIT